MYELRICSSSLHDFQILKDIQLGNAIPPPHNKALDGAVFQQPVSGLGADALAAIGIVTPLFIIIIGLGIGLSAGVNSSVARFIGKGDMKNAGNSATHGVVLSIIVSIVIPGIILLFLDPLLIAIGGANVLGLAHEYGVWIIAGGFTIIIQNIYFIHQFIVQFINFFYTDIFYTSTLNARIAN